MFNIYEALSSGTGKATMMVVVVVVGFAAEPVLYSIQSLLFGRGRSAQMVEVATLSIDDHREILLSEHAQSISDVRIIMCSFLKDGEPVVEDAIFGMTNLDPQLLKFETLNTTDGDLVGVVEVSNPRLLIVTWKLSDGAAAELYDVGLTDGAISRLTEHTQALARANSGQKFEHLALIRQAELRQQTSSNRSRRIW